MEVDVSIISQQLEEIEEDEVDDELYVAGTAMSIMLLGAIEAHRLRTERRKPSRLYLCHAQLSRNPRGCTVWQILHRSHNDRVYITAMGFDVGTFNKILGAGFDFAWNTTPIPREDALGTGKTRPGARSFDTLGALGLLLHYLNSTMREISLQQVFASIPSTISQYITFGLKLLLQTLHQMPECSIRWPKNEEFSEYNQLIIACHPLLTCAFVSLDRLNLGCQTSDDEEIENATYNGWLCEHYVGSVLAFSPKGNIIAAKLNAPGSWHDSRITQDIYEKLRTRTPDGFYLMRGTMDEIEERLAFDRELLSHRQTAEGGMRGVSSSADFGTDFEGIRMCINVH
ncbi:hypothetical protein DFH07DRAFT_870725 [Mycena maculata]|uniref:DDE Tnp4 domain-containing protein n=1 Tax=Mycena maculata TaxID=230809 RepID=A0AAD7MY41_9AGAR|nr:hypothetical protein DFH07DRAFT_870725 [Mycena maculata]